MELMPNPCSDKLFVNYESLSGIVEMRVYSVLGKLVYSNHLSGSPAEINTASWPPGLYFVCIQVGSKRVVQKILKE
jgi:hypothetical protein